ncbi:hypothetical protein [Paenibacillus sp. MBLB4367]|uniref:hypothetical protein n=1 Tax=Paenibacillus sp. MBLB4367 TaxID=3384767 RepID=UPI003907E7A5
MGNKRSAMKRGVSALVGTALVVSALAGCADGESKPGAAGSESPKADKKMLLKFWSYTPDKTNLQGYGMNFLRQKFNIDIDFYAVPNETLKEKLQLMLSSKDIPDWWKPQSYSDYDKYVSQGLVAEIPEDLLEQYAPKYMAWLRKNTGSGDPFRYVRRSGKVYQMQDMWTIGPKSTVVGFRDDWLKKVGIAKTPETIEEMETALAKFRNDDPDGNGKKDTYGITGTAIGVAGIFSSVFGAFGVYPGTFTEDNGKVVLGEIESAAKDALTVLQRWYKNELIDPEFVTNKGANKDDKMINGKAGVAEAAWWSFIPQAAFFSGVYYEKTREKNPSAAWVTIGGPKGPAGKSGMIQSTPFSATGVVFGKHMEKDRDKLIKYLQVFDDTISNPDTFEATNYGEKGKTFKVSEDGSYEFIPPYDKEEEQIKYGVGPWYSIPRSFNDYEMQAKFMTKKSLIPVRQAAESKGTGKYDILSPTQRPVYNEYKERLDQFTLQTFIDFITGRKPVSEFDSFVAEWKKMGGDKVLEEAQLKFKELK